MKICYSCIGWGCTTTRHIKRQNINLHWSNQPAYYPHLPLRRRWAVMNSIWPLIAKVGRYRNSRNIRFQAYAALIKNIINYMAKCFYPHNWKHIQMDLAMDWQRKARDYSFVRHSLIQWHIVSSFLENKILFNFHQQKRKVGILAYLLPYQNRHIPRNVLHHWQNKPYLPAPLDAGTLTNFPTKTIISRVGQLEWNVSNCAYCTEHRNHISPLSDAHCASNFSVTQKRLPQLTFVAQDVTCSCTPTHKPRILYDNETSSRSAIKHYKIEIFVADERLTIDCSHSRTI